MVHATDPLQQAFELTGAARHAARDILDAVLETSDDELEAEAYELLSAVDKLGERLAVLLREQRVRDAGAAE